MEWLQVQSVDELKTLGKYVDINREVKGILGKLEMPGRGWEGLYKKVVAIQKLVQQVGASQDNSSNGQSACAVDPEAYFQNEAVEYIYYLAELDGEERAKKLKITLRHYKNKKIAKTWRDTISKKIHPDVSKHPKAEAAMSKLSDLYEDMIGR